MTQVAIAASQDESDATGSSGSGTEWTPWPFPLGGATLLTAVQADADKFIRITLPGDGTWFAHVVYTLDILSEPAAGTHTFAVTHETNVGNIFVELFNGSDDSVIYTMFLNDGAGYETQTHDLTSPEIASILDYGYLRVRVSCEDADGTAFFVNDVDSFSFTIPDASLDMIDLRPDADVTTTGWTSTPLWSKVEESSADGTVITGTPS